MDGVKVVVITGASRGFGAKLVEAFVRDGAVVVPASRPAVDVSDPQSVSAFIADVIHKYGRVDILVNNAGILGPVGQIEQNDQAEWQQTISVNLLGPVWMTQTVIPTMLKQQSGRIINVAGGGATCSLPRRTAYAASKAALVRLTESVADEVKDDGIFVNAILPGPLPTDMLDQIIASGPDRLGTVEHAKHERPDALDFDRAIGLCLYLASEESAPLTGRTFSARFDLWPFSDDDKADIMAGDRYTLRRRDGH